MMCYNSNILVLGKEINMIIKDSISNTGNINNEDYIAFEKGGYAIVLDGSTGLGKHVIAPLSNGIYQTDAQWLVASFAQIFSKHYMEEKTLPQVVEICLLELERQYNDFPLEPEDKAVINAPSASLSIVRLKGDTAELYMAGDCTVIVKEKGKEVEEIRDLSVSKLDDIGVAVMKQLAKEHNCSMANAMAMGPVKEKLMANRKKKNKVDEDGGYLVLTPESGYSQYGIYRKFLAAEIEEMMIVTDGIACCYQTYDLTSSAAGLLNMVKEKTFKKVVEEERLLENNDSEYNKYPRFKKSDDASGILLSF